MTVHEGVSSQAGLASFRPWTPDHSTFVEDALIREARAVKTIDPDPWTEEYKARYWAYRQETDEMNGKYIDEVLDAEDDDGTMVNNVEELRAQVVGHKIIRAERVERERNNWGLSVPVFEIQLDNGKVVRLADEGDCCAYTELESFLLNVDRVDHVITGVGTTDGYTKWHIYADMGDVLEMSVGWSCGNPFYYGYGFDITVEEQS